MTNYKKLIKALREESWYVDSNGVDDTLDGIIATYLAKASDAIEELVPKTARWEDTYKDGDMHCTNCGAIVEKDEQLNHNWYYCYHCGAKMENPFMDTDEHS